MFLKTIKIQKQQKINFGLDKIQKNVKFLESNF